MAEFPDLVGQHTNPAPTPSVPPQAAKPAGAAPGGWPVKAREKVKLGDDQVKAVAKLAADLAGPAGKLNFKVGAPKTFGLELDVFDPETGLLFSAAHAQRRDIGVAGHIMTVDEVVADIVSVRMHAQTSGAVKYVDEQPKH